MQKKIYTKAGIDLQVATSHSRLTSSGSFRKRRLHIGAMFLLSNFLLIFY